MVKPYSDEEGTNHKIRTFLESVDEEELIWHRDRNDREIAVLEGRDWKLQKDNLLPVKLKKGMLRALEKRPLSTEQIDAVFGKILSAIRVHGEKEIQSLKVGEIMMDSLKEIDKVAYVRFASVYRDFQDIEDFSAEVHSVNKEKKSKKSKKK